MINEWVEFCAYTGTVSYTASKKSDTTWLGRFTFATILEFEGMSRILTVLARGYLFHGEDGAVISGDPHDRVDHARRALCAWCSVPEDGKRVQDKEWQFQTDFSELHPEFPELVDADGVGWFLRHVLRAADFMLTHPEKVRSTSLKYAEVIQSKFAAATATSLFRLISLPLLSTAPPRSTSVSKITPRSAPDSLTASQIESIASLASGFGTWFGNIPSGSR